MSPMSPRQTRAPRRHARRVLLMGAAAALLSACGGGGFSPGDLFNNSSAPPPQAGPAATIGAGQAMRNAAELAIAEFNNPNIQLLVKDDGGSSQGAQQATQQALDEGAEIVLGPLFAHSVAPAGQTARARGIPVIAFSTDSNVA